MSAAKFSREDFCLIVRSHGHVDLDNEGSDNMYGFRRWKQQSRDRLLRDRPLRLVALKTALMQGDPYYSWVSLTPKSATSSGINNVGFL